MEDKIKFPANVILIDVAFLNEVVYGAKNFLEGKLGRKLPDVDLPAWLSYLALDAGLREQENEVEVLLVHTPAADVLKCCEPSDVNKLNHQACRTPPRYARQLPPAGAISILALRHRRQGCRYIKESPHGQVTACGDLSYR